MARYIYHPGQPDDTDQIPDKPAPAPLAAPPTAAPPIIQQSSSLPPAASATSAIPAVAAVGRALYGSDYSDTTGAGGGGGAPLARPVATLAPPPKAPLPAPTAPNPPITYPGQSGLDKATTAYNQSYGALQKLDQGRAKFLADNPSHVEISEDGIPMYSSSANPSIVSAHQQIEQQYGAAHDQTEKLRAAMQAEQAKQTAWQNAQDTNKSLAGYGFQPTATSSAGAAPATSPAAGAPASKPAAPAVPPKPATPATPVAKVDPAAPVISGGSGLGGQYATTDATGETAYGSNTGSATTVASSRNAQGNPVYDNASIARIAAGANSTAAAPSSVNVGDLPANAPLSAPPAVGGISYSSANNAETDAANQERLNQAKRIDGVLDDLRLYGLNNEGKRQLYAQLTNARDSLVNTGVDAAGRSAIANQSADVQAGEAGQRAQTAAAGEQAATQRAVLQNLTELTKAQDQPHYVADAQGNYVRVANGKSTPVIGPDGKQLNTFQSERANALRTLITSATQNGDTATADSATKQLQELTGAQGPSPAEKALNDARDLIATGKINKQEAIQRLLKFGYKDQAGQL